MGIVYLLAVSHTVQSPRNRSVFHSGLRVVREAGMQPELQALPTAITTGFRASSFAQMPHCTMGNPSPPREYESKQH